MNSFFVDSISKVEYYKIRQSIERRKTISKIFSIEDIVVVGWHRRQTGERHTRVRISVCLFISLGYFNTQKKIKKCFDVEKRLFGTERITSRTCETVLWTNNNTSTKLPAILRIYLVDFFWCCLSACSFQLVCGADTHFILC